MKIDVRFQGISASEALREHAVQRARFTLSRFGAEVRSVSVSFADINGPKGGIDTRCRVHVRGAGLGAVTLESLSHDAYSAIADVLDRAQRAVRRQLERRREGHPPAHRRAS